MGEPHGVPGAAADGPHIGWGAQARDDHAVPWSLRAATFWPQTADRAAPVLLLAAPRPRRSPMRCSSPAGRCLDPVRGGRRRPRVGRALIAAGLDRLPEETAPPPELRALDSAGDRTARRYRAAVRLVAMLESLAHVRAASCGRCASITATARRRAAMDALYRQFVGRAILSSTSAPMSATASPPSAGWARGGRG